MGERNGGKPCRTAKAREPCQTLRVFADIFAHMFVGNGNDKPIQLAAFELLAQGGEAGFMGLHQHSA